MAELASTGSLGAATRSLPFWVDELPYIAMLLLTLGGVTYASVSPRATFDYWQILVPIFALICIVAGWRRSTTKAARLRLVWTQLLHWGAIIVAMRLLFMPHVQQMLTSDAVGLAAMALMALGTFLAGVHAASWRVGLVGLFLAAAVPVAAMLEQAVLIVLLIGAVLLGIFALTLWLQKRRGVGAMAAALLLCVVGQGAMAQTAPAEKCGPAVAHRLEEYGLSLDKMKDLQWFTSPAPAGEPGPLVVWLYGTPDSCTAGRVVMLLTGTCDILSVYSRPPCQVQGIPYHWW